MILRRIAIAALSVSLLSGCAAGHSSVTIKPYTPTDGNQAMSGSIKVVNFVVVAQADGSADVIGTVVNSAVEGDSITGLTINNTPVALTALPLEQNKPVIFGGESATTNLKVPVIGAKPGQLVPMTMTFAKAAPVTMSLLVREPTLEFTPTAPATPAAPVTP